MANGITSPTIEINNEYFPIQPESVVYRKGTGTVTTTMQSIGQTVEPVHKRNLTEAYGYISFKTENITSNMALINTVRENDGNNKVVMYDVKTGFKTTMTNAIAMNEIERTLSSDGDGTVEMCGNVLSGNV